MNSSYLVRHNDEIDTIVAGDRCYLKEIFHPQRHSVQTSHSLAYAWVEPGGKTLSHYLLESETYYVISGEGILYVNQQAIKVSAGSSCYIPPKCNQYLVNTGNDPLCFLVIVDPPWQKENEFIVERL